jgi:hypothetical protein
LQPNAFFKAEFLRLESAFLLPTAAGHKRIAHLSFECKRMHEECALKKKRWEFLEGKYDNSLSLILVELCALGGGSCACGGVFTQLTVSRSNSRS